MVAEKIQMQMINTPYKNISKRIVYKIALFVSCGLPFSTIAQTVNDGGIRETQSVKPLTGIVSTAISDPLIANQSSIIDYYSYGIQSTQQTKKIKNVITFSINEETDQFITQDFTATANVKIEYGHNASSLITIPSQSFIIDYKKAEGAKYNASQYFHFDDAEYVKITLLSIEAPIIGNLNTKNILFLKNEMIITRYFELPNVVPAPSEFYPVIPPPPADPTDIPDHLTVHFEWPSITGSGLSTGNNATQLEWAWVEDEVAGFYSISGVLNYDLIFKNSSRVDLDYSTLNYDIPLLYDGVGKLYYRIRAVNFKESGTHSDGPWIIHSPFDFAGHKNNLNWQATTTFSEEGKRKSVIQYFDGSLRARQTVTKENSTNTVVTAETFYDGQGRPAIQILPTPGITDIIKYQANLNLFNGQTQNQDPADIFDMVPVAAPNSFTPALATTSGTSKYYSSANTDGPANIPDAEGYPYSVTRYSPDATGRVVAQSGVGLAYKMGSGHETKYYYGGAAQEELDGLFGTEVGNFTHYSKNMVKDANGQVSVSYIDMHGRTVATALAGDAPKDVSGNFILQPLDNNNPSHYPSQAGSNITRNLLDINSNIIKANSIESVNSLLVPAPKDYTFRYELNPQILELAACEGANPATLCYDCLYDLEIVITDESGESVPIIRKFNNVSLNQDDDCNTPNSVFKDLSNNVISNVITFVQPLEPGSYSIRKTLSISESSLQYYKDLYINKALCKTEQQLVDSVYNVLLGTSNCENPTPVTCQTCLTQLGTLQDYRPEYLSSLGLSPNETATSQIENDIKVAYNTALQSCNKMCDNTSQSIPTIRQMMLLDMVPFSGQYAQRYFDDAVPSHTMFDRYNIFSTDDPSIQQPFYMFPCYKTTFNPIKIKDFYYDETRNVDLTIHPDVSPILPYTFLNETTPVEFEGLFKNSWAASLLPHHPEYDRLVFAETYLTPSYNWISAFMQIDYTTAQSGGYFNPVAIDPFFQVAPFTYSTLMNGNSGAIANYQGMGAGIWQLAYGDVKCKSISADDLRQDCYLQGNPDNLPPPYAGFSDEENEQAWKVFRGLYAAVRNSLVNKYIATSRPLPLNDENDLITQKFRLWFPRNDQQIAAQNEWTWWPPTLGEAPTGEGAGGGTVAASATYSNQCSSYINRWKVQLLQCDALNNDPNKEDILDEITTRMQAVCVNGSDQSNPYGASNVAPSTPASVTDRSFEDVIKSVFIAHGIINSNGNYADNYCNPFVIEWPKPYGKGPKMIAGEFTGQIDDCNCSQFSILKTEAAAQHVDVDDLDQFNQYLLANHGDALTKAVFKALQQHCGNSSTSPECICKDLNETIDLYYDQYPNGEIEGCNPYDLQIDFRSGNQPSEYVASYSITFLPGFESAAADEFVAYINPVCDTICHNQFVDFFNSHNNNNPPLTWLEIDDLYQENCGHSPYVCGYTDYSCIELRIVECHFLNLNTQPSKDYQYRPLLPDCQQNFTSFFNTYYHNIIPLSWLQIQALYSPCDSNFIDHICGSLPVDFCGEPLPLNNCISGLPYVLEQPLQLPDFLKCGYVKNDHCISCAGLSTFTGEFKEAFASSVNTAPIFTGNDLTPDQVQYNMNYARFINYRTGFQFNWMDYSKAAADAQPACDLANYDNNSNALQNVICGSSKPLAPDISIPEEDPCARVYTMAITRGEQIYQLRQQFLLQQFEASYKEKCLAAKDIEQFTVNYNTSEYHYTLYYYDMAGNLVKTVPPKGVNPDFSTTFINSVEEYRNTGDYTLTPITPLHTFTTDYRYNSLGQVTAQNTPDAGTANFWYDALGRLAVSQNKKQFNTNRFSYTIYDNLGRITQVGQKPQAANSMNQSVSQNPGLLGAWINANGNDKEQITYTVYDLYYTPLAESPTFFTQENLRNRVSWTSTVENTAISFSASTVNFYSYDVHGNVVRLLNEYGGILQAMPDNEVLYKQIHYAYDLISGKVNQVSYQPGFEDAFYHRYNYDADNRLKYVETSRDQIVWERDAEYNYYKHGPLSRIELGKLRVQGTDYAYTLQGWLKGINQTSLDPAKDIGLDGTLQSTAAKDALSFALHYYDETVGANQYIDYKPIAGTSAFARPGSSGNIKSLYNGNIAAMSVNNAGLLKANAATSNTMPLLYNYRYDQLNRIVSMQAYKGLDAAANQWNAITIDDYKEATSYDPNGNILTYNRKGAPSAGMPSDMDALNYDYYPNTNQLQHVGDDISFTNKYSEAANGTADIDNQTNPNNYTYDAIGNLISDATVGEEITNIDWSVYGKILSINKATGNIMYSYDAGGNRISKTVGNKTTFYLRDATGNVMSVYESVANGISVQKETHLYGSSRLGIQTELTVAPVPVSLYPGFGDGKLSTFTRGEKIFELSNHLGNVLATVSDKKIQHTTNNNLVDYYNTEVITANDYYPFGMQMPGRKYAASSFNKYRYGFNGKENDNEAGGDGNQYDYGFRIYNSRIGRFLSVDPLTQSYPWYSPYQFAGNKPIWAADLDGLEEWMKTQEILLRQSIKLQQQTIQNQQSKVRQQALQGMAQQPTVGPAENSSYSKERSNYYNRQYQFNQAINGATIDPLAGSMIYPIANAAGQYSKGVVNHTIGAYEAYKNGNFWEGTKNAGLLALDVLPYIKVPLPITAIIPTRLVRVIEERFAGESLLGKASDVDVFVADANELKGLKNSVDIAEKLTLKNMDGSFRKGPFRLIEFDTPAEGLAQPLNRTNPGYLNGGKTAGGATDYVIPNTQINLLKNVTQTTIK